MREPYTLTLGVQTKTLPGQDAPFHRFELIYHRIMEGMRTDHFCEVPTFEFIAQEWLFKLGKEVQRSTGLNPLYPEHQSDISKIVAHLINEPLAKLRVYDSAFADALLGYYAASQQGNEGPLRRHYDRLKPERGRRRTRDYRHPLIAPGGFAQIKLYEVALQVGQAHGAVYAWDAIEHRPDEWRKHLIEETVTVRGTI